MKKYLLKISSVCLLTSILFISCGKEKTIEAIAEGPSINVDAAIATASDNQRSGGIYKGILIGATGYIKFALESRGQMAVIQYNGINRAMNTSDLKNWTSGQAINNANFTAGEWKVVLSVAADGSNPVISVTIPGITTSGLIAKETTTAAVKVYEGTFSVNGQNGIINLLTKGADVNGLLKATDNKIFNIKGLVTNNTLNATGNSDTGLITAIGTLANENITGTFNETGTNYTVSGTWSAKKTL